ncbi:MAG: Rieske 2Fe-2S domain-containing protein [Marinilabiliaceae bacterium]
MKSFLIYLIYPILTILLTGCGDQVRDEFPQTSFVGYFNLNHSEYSGTVFTAQRDRDGNRVGISGIIVYQNSADEYYAFERMCPHEKKHNCKVHIDPDEDTNIAECKCCGSRFLIANENGEVIEGKAPPPGLKRYRTAFDRQTNQLVVSSGR